MLAAATSSDEDIAKLTVKDLKDRLRERGLSVSGLKAELVMRLRRGMIGEADAASVEFNALAAKEGFDDSTAFFADDQTFEENFVVEAGDDDDDADGGGVDGDGDEKEKEVNAKFPDTIYLGDDFELDLGDDDFDDEDDDDDDIPDFGGGGGTSMDDRIAAAISDRGRGRINIPDADGLAKFTIEQAGGADAIPDLALSQPQMTFKLTKDASSCPGCGSKFQSDDVMRPGFLPFEKFEMQTRLAEYEERRKLMERQLSGDAEWSTDDEIEWLLKGGADGEEEDSDAEAEEEEMDEETLAKLEKTMCKRCHGLQNYGTVEEHLRPGWTDEPTLSQQQFRDLLLPLRNKPCVILAIVDLFDFSGSVLPELDQIAGDNPVILLANKADLLPAQMGTTRAESWVRRELEHLGVTSIANIGGAVRLASCKTGFGVAGALEKARKLAEEMDGDIYVVGAANAGKSTLINRLIDDRSKGDDRRNGGGGKKRAGNANKHKGAVTTSPLPGTTLKFIEVDLGDGRSLYDTPGLLVPGSLTERLTPAELKVVVPKKRVEPITFRVSSGKCVLVGGLAKIELVGDCKPFLFTFFVANDVKLHPTDSDKADEFTAKHAGGILVPPLEGGPENLARIGEFESVDVDIRGDGWKEAAADITLRGLGWVAVTGVGMAKVRISVPRGIGISVRPPLMPFDIMETTAKYTGGRATRKSSKSRSGKRRKGVGRN